MAWLQARRTGAKGRISSSSNPGNICTFSKCKWRVFQGKQTLMTTNLASYCHVSCSRKITFSQLDLYLSVTKPTRFILHEWFPGGPNSDEDCHEKETELCHSTGISAFGSGTNHVTLLSADLLMVTSAVQERTPDKRENEGWNPRRCHDGSLNSD